MLTICILIAIIAYLIGSINFSVILSKKMAGFDVRQKGSGNAGTTNMLRSVGKKAAAITLICDILKGVVSIGIAILVGYLFNAQNKSILVQIAAIAVVIGHTFPIFFGFKGGKGVATSLGVLIMTNWQIGLICLAIAIIIMAITKMVSLGSCMAAIAFPLLTYFAANIFENAYIVKEGSSYFVYSIILAVIVLFNHRSNIKRIITGKENKLSFKKESLWSSLTAGCFI